MSTSLGSKGVIEVFAVGLFLVAVLAISSRTDQAVDTIQKHDNNEME
jgi:hypothetical protein